MGIRKEAVDFKSHCLSGAATCTMDLTSTREFKREGAGVVRTKHAQSESVRWSKAKADRDC